MTLENKPKESQEKIIQIGFKKFEEFAEFVSIEDHPIFDRLKKNTARALEIIDQLQLNTSLLKEYYEKNYSNVLNKLLDTRKFLYSMSHLTKKDATNQTLEEIKKSAKKVWRESKP